MTTRERLRWVGRNLGRYGWVIALEALVLACFLLPFFVTGALVAVAFFGTAFFLLSLPGAVAVALALTYAPRDWPRTRRRRAAIGSALFVIGASTLGVPAAASGDVGWLMFAPFVAVGAGAFGMLAHIDPPARIRSRSTLH